MDRALRDSGAITTLYGPAGRTAGGGRRGRRRRPAPQPPCRTKRRHAGVELVPAHAERLPQRGVQAGLRGLRAGHGAHEVLEAGGPPPCVHVVDERTAELVPEPDRVHVPAVPHVVNRERLGQWPELVARGDLVAQTRRDGHALRSSGDALHEQRGRIGILPEPAHRVRVRQLVDEHPVDRLSRVAEPRAHHPDVVDLPVLLGHAQRQVGEEPEPDAREPDRQGVAHVLGRAVNGDEHGGAGVQTERLEPRPRPTGGRGDRLRPVPRPAVGEHDEAGALQHDGVVQRHEVPATEVLRGHVGGDGHAVPRRDEPEVADHGQPVGRSRSSEAAAAHHTVDALPVRERSDREAERRPGQRRERGTDLVQAFAQPPGGRCGGAHRESLGERGRVAFAQRGGGSPELRAGKLEDPGLLRARIGTRITGPPGAGGSEENEDGGGAGERRSDAAAAERTAAAAGRGAAPVDPCVHLPRLATTRPPYHRGSVRDAGVARAVENAKTRSRVYHEKPMTNRRDKPYTTYRAGDHDAPGSPAAWGGPWSDGVAAGGGGSSSGGRPPYDRPPRGRDRRRKRRGGGLLLLIVLLSSSRPPWASRPRPPGDPSAVATPRPAASPRARRP